MTRGRAADERPQLTDDPTAPPAPRLLPDPGDSSTPDLDRRLEDIASVIQAFASLRFDARAPLGPDGDLVDAVAAGVNFLGEELEASYREVERRVADRTAELTRATDELRRRSLHDALTGLANRALALERLTHRLELADRREQGFAVLFLDLDGFKDVNDGLGHAAGDRLLEEAAGRMRGALRSGDTAARMGGDEFIVLLDEVLTGSAALGVAERLSRALGEPYEIGPEPLRVPASIGVVMGPASFRTADELIAAADTAMYRAKRRGGGRCALYRNDERRLPGG